MKKAINVSKKEHRSNIIEHEEKDSFRLNKYISDSGYSSRREADRLIEQGLVTINGVKAVLGTKVYEGQEVRVNNELISNNVKKVYIMLNKPVGITCTNDLSIKGNIRSFVNYPETIFPIGRLDKDSTGLILLTNDGDIVNKILRAEHGHEKEYIVTLNKHYDKDFILRMESGVRIFNQVANKHQKTSPSKIIPIDSKTFKIIISQGLNRQIRRMADTLGYQVTALKRIRIINVHLNDLEVGKWRYLTDQELIQLNKDINY